jgi:hypothetical protein
MSTRYRVSIERIEDTPDGQYSTQETTLFEATHQDPTRLARFAPVEILEALVIAGGGQIDTSILESAGRVAKWAEGGSFSVPMTGSSGLSLELPKVAEEPPVTPEPEPATEGETEKPKRARRTKAQIAADKAAEELGYRDAAHRAEVEASAPETAEAVRQASAMPEGPGKESAPGAGESAAPAPASPPPVVPALPTPAFNPFL